MKEAWKGFCHQHYRSMTEGMRREVRVWHRMLEEGTKTLPEWQEWLHKQDELGLISNGHDWQ